jgi:acetone carboxylase, gamma subunit
MPDYDQKTIADLIDGKLGWPELHEMMSNYKDPDRFDKYLAVLQERAPWDEKILLPLGPHLFIVRKDDGAIVTKSTSGFEFGDYRENWKRSTTNGSDGLCRISGVAFFCVPAPCVAAHAVADYF